MADRPKSGISHSGWDVKVNSAGIVLVPIASKRPHFARGVFPVSLLDYSRQPGHFRRGDAGGRAKPYASRGRQYSAKPQLLQPAAEKSSPAWRQRVCAVGLRSANGKAESGQLAAEFPGLEQTDMMDFVSPPV